jgi:hypothetical protein
LLDKDLKAGTLTYVYSRFLKGDRHMESRNQHTKVVFSSILGIALAFQFCAARIARGQEHYSGGITRDITDVDDSLVYIEGKGTIVNFRASFQGIIFVSPDLPGATLNLLADARANIISAGPGSFVNLHGGAVDFLVSVEVDAHVTIYGEKFVVLDELKRTTYERKPGTKLSVTRARVTAYDKWGHKLFTGRLSCEPDASVLLRTGTDNLKVQIDVEPDSNPSIISLHSEGTVPVAVLSDETFDATQVLPETVRFAGASVAVGGKGKHMAKVEDVDEDGDDDMLFHFRTNDLKLADGVKEAKLTLTGKLKDQVAAQSARPTKDGTRISGSDNVYILRPKKEKLGNTGGVGNAERYQKDAGDGPS